MKISLRHGYRLALVGILGLAASVAFAATSNGTISLPMQAYWYNTLLPAGEYKLSVETAPAGVSLISIRGENVEATFLAPGALRREHSATSFLKLDNINGTYVIRELSSTALNRSYTFGISKAVKERMLSGSAAPSVNVPVSTGL